MACGRAHGAQPEDVYGCLYFFLSAQLRTFRRRIQKQPIHFKFFVMDARKLAAGIQDGSFSHMDLPPTVRFDRIDVSNIMDANYVGVQDVLTQWAPLLKKGKHATLLGYFMNWFLLQSDGRVMGGDAKAMDRPSVKRAIDLMVTKRKVCTSYVVPLVAVA